MAVEMHCCFLYSASFLSDLLRRHQFYAHYIRLPFLKPFMLETSIFLLLNLFMPKNFLFLTSAAAAWLAGNVLEKKKFHFFLSSFFPSHPIFFPCLEQAKLGTKQVRLFAQDRKHFVCRSGDGTVRFWEKSSVSQPGFWRIISFLEILQPRGSWRFMRKPLLLFVKTALLKLA